MATFYLDFENGSDALDGTTFANRWKTLTNGATAARIAPGDEIRIMGSPAPTSLGQNGVWTSQARQSHLWINGQTTNPVGSTNTTPIVMGVTNHGYSTGDTVVIAGHIVNTTANGIWEITVIDSNRFSLNGSVATVGGGTGWQGTSTKLSNCRVLLETPVTQNIASTGPGRTAWTASANVTTSLNGSSKEDTRSDSIAIGANFTTGLAAYWALPSTLDLSGYQQVSFWIMQTAGTVGAAGAIDLRLCSDNAGVTAVNTVSIPNLAATSRWMPVTVDLGTALGSSIQSIALYVNTDNGAQTFLLSNIIACKASSDPDSLTLTSLIGKNTTGETFWGIQSINGTRVMLDADTNAGLSGSSVRGYYGTSETVTTWKRETIKMGPDAQQQNLNEGGGNSTSTDFANFITFSGGWDRTSMSTQNLETWIDGVNGRSTGINIANFIYGIALRKIGIVRYSTAINTGLTYHLNIDIEALNNNTSSAFTSSSSFSGSELIKIKHVAANSSHGININNGNGDLHDANITANFVSNNGTAIFTRIRKKVKIYDSLFFNNLTGLNLSIGDITSIFNNCVFRDSGSLLLFGGFYFKNCIFENTVVDVSDHWRTFYSQNHDQTANNHRIQSFGMTISSAVDQRNTASGISWKLQPTSSQRNQAFPVSLSLAKVVCAANSLVTIKAWMRRSDTGLTMRLVCKGGQLAGIPSDVVDSMTATADTWAEQTITFTPTEAGVVEITAEAWGGTTFSGWVDDMTISQE